MSRKKRSTPFQPGHGLLYGLRPVARDPDTNAVTSVACRFCEKFGREEKAGAKRRATQRVKLFKQPFRTENYHQHHSGQHRIRWAEYKTLPAERKVAYLASATEPPAQDAYTHIANVVNEPSAATPVQPAPDAIPVLQDGVPIPPSKTLQRVIPLKFMIERPIIDVVIGEMLVDTVHENTTKDRAISAFTSPTHEAIKDYCVKIANTQLFDATIAFVCQGATPRVASAMITEMAKSASPANGDLRSLAECSEAKVAAYIRCVISYNLQALRDIFRHTWGFGLCLARMEYLSNFYVDVSIRICVTDDIHTFHIISCPIPDRFNLDAIYKTISSVLQAISTIWTHHLVGVSTDGSEEAQTTAHDIIDRIRPETSANLLRTWSGAYQLELLVKSVYQSVLDDNFYDTLSNLVSYLRRQEPLIRELKEICPKVDPSSWRSMGTSLRWIKTHRIRILQYLDKKQPGFGPNMAWWVLAMALFEFTHAVSKTYVRIRGMTTLVADQLAHLSELLQTLQRVSGCKGPITADELHLLTQWDLIVDGNFCVQKTQVRNFLSGLGSFVHVSTTELPSPLLDDVIHSVGAMFLSAVVGLSAIIESRNEATVGTGSLPPVLPNELVKLSRVAFNSNVRGHAHRLTTVFSPAEIEKIEEEFGDFLEAYHREEIFNDAVQTVTHHKDFQSAWGILRDRFRKLYQFCGGIGSAYPGEFCSTPEFSICRDGIEMFRIAGMTDFPLEGSLHCKQYTRLKSLLELCQTIESFRRRW